MKPYYQIPIVECHELLVPIPADVFAFVLPHPYAHAGAPYGDRSPFCLRQGVLDRLLMAQTALQQTQPGWKIEIFDAYRPIAVQQYMVDHTFQELTQLRGWDAATLTESQRQTVYEQVYEFWAVPSRDPAMPPPHSTGSVVDVTLLDEIGEPVDMGSPIDEISPRSYPDHFAESEQQVEQHYHQQRQLLNQVMMIAGFRRHPNEWWHFCYGDQMWAWLMNQETPEAPYTAQYGSVD